MLAVAASRFGAFALNFITALNHLDVAADMLISVALAVASAGIFPGRAYAHGVGST